MNISVVKVIYNSKIKAKQISGPINGGGRNMVTTHKKWSKSEMQDVIKMLKAYLQQIFIILLMVMVL